MKHTAWTATERDLLRKQWPNVRLDDYPGRTIKAIQVMAVRLRVTKPKKTAQRPWTSNDDSIIAANISRPWPDVAMQLGRTVQAVRSRAARLRMVKQKPTKLMGATDDQLILMHAMGMPNKQIYEILGFSDECLRKHFRRLGLQSNERDYVSAEKVREKTMLATYGVKNVARLRSQRNKLQSIQRLLKLGESK